ncbi:unnamed protein product [Closterium sp. Naga37s-1]|nr:unnamed protein product [Closterium sp. Naga37s-1]
MLLCLLVCFYSPHSPQLALPSPHHPPTTHPALSLSRGWTAMCSTCSYLPRSFLYLPSLTQLKARSVVFSSYVCQPFSFPPPTPPLRSHPHYTHPACPSCLAAPGGRQQRYQLHAISALHVHPLSHTRPCTPCAVQVVDNNAISRRVACHFRPSVLIQFGALLDLPMCYADGGRQLHQPATRAWHLHASVLIPFQPRCMPLALPVQVVDDNAINQRVAASTLAQYGAEVALAESGEAALRLL